jgi:hypothetical protein
LMLAGQVVHGRQGFAGFQPPALDVLADQVRQLTIEEALVCAAVRRSRLVLLLTFDVRSNLGCASPRNFSLRIRRA